MLRSHWCLQAVGKWIASDLLVQAKKFVEYCYKLNNIRHFSFFFFKILTNSISCQVFRLISIYSLWNDFKSMPLFFTYFFKILKFIFVYTKRSESTAIYKRIELKLLVFTSSINKYELLLTHIREQFVLRDCIISSKQYF